MDPNNCEILMTRAQIYKKMGDYQSALNDLEKYKSINPNDFEVFFEIGRIYFYDLDDKHTAREYLLESLRT